MGTETEVLSPEIVVQESYLPLVQDDAAAELVATLGPLVAKRDEYRASAAAVVVRNEDEAMNAKQLMDAIGADQKAAQDAIKGHKDAAKARHTRWCQLEAYFVDTLEAARKVVKGKILNFQIAEQKRRDEEQRRLQAEADERARKEQERLQKEAAKLKTPEKAQAKLDQAAAVVAPTVEIAKVKTGVSARRVWKAEVTDTAAFLKAVYMNPMLMGYVSINVTALQRTKAANPDFAVDGVVFNQEVV